MNRADAKLLTRRITDTITARVSEDPLSVSAILKVVSFLLRARVSIRERTIPSAI